MSPPEFTAKFRLEASVSPSEDPGKVAGALLSIIGRPLEVTVDGDRAALTTDDLGAISHIRDQLRDRHIRTAARRQLLLNGEGRTTFMMLNRQAAAAGVVAICGSAEESPLGPVYATIESDHLAAVVDWLTAYEAG
ncbi:MAG TPA: hypothetical protein VLX33_00805 [Nitrososphaerales archaeon]|nr:hypothetical protein [Nitrososphaerales archaeon]